MPCLLYIPHYILTFYLISIWPFEKSLYLLRYSKKYNLVLISIFFLSFIWNCPGTCSILIIFILLDIVYHVFYINMQYLNSYVRILICVYQIICKNANSKYCLLNETICKSMKCSHNEFLVWYLPEIHRSPTHLMHR